MVEDSPARPGAGRAQRLRTAARTRRGGRV